MTEAIAIRQSKQLRKALSVTGVKDHQDVIKYIRVMQSISKIEEEHDDVLHSKKQNTQEHTR